MVQPSPFEMFPPVLRWISTEKLPDGEFLLPLVTFAKYSIPAVEVASRSVETITVTVDEVINELSISTVSVPTLDPLELVTLRYPAKLFVAPFAFKPVD